MPFRLTIQPPVLFASWRGFSTDDLREITDRIADMRRTTRRPVAYLSRLPASRHVFTDAEQEVLLGFLLAILPHCATIHHVVEGDGFIRSTRMAIITKLSTTTPRPRAFYTHQTLGEGLRSLKALYGVDLSKRAQATSDAPPAERASGAFREAVRIVDGGRGHSRKG